MHHLATNVLFILAIVTTFATNISIQAIIPPPDDDGEWFLKFRYGSGAPKDAGRLGHCTATVTKSGKVRIVSKGRRGVAGPKDAIYEKDVLDEKELKAIFNAADVAFSEPPFKRSGVMEDGHFLRLERADSNSTRVYHSQMNDFASAPPAMIKFVELINKLVPEKERIPLKARVTVKGRD